MLWYDKNMRRISRSFNNIHFSKYSHPPYSTLWCKAKSCFHLINTKKPLSFIPLLRQLKFKCHITMQWTIKLSTRNSSITAGYLHDNKNHHDCTFLSCHVRVSVWIHTIQLPECQRTPCSKQAQNLRFKWLQLDSNPEPLSS